MKIPPPNYTQTPNDLFDHWLPLLGEGELKVLLVIMRKTFGWHKTHDVISVSQLAKYTGLREETVITAAKSLQSKGVIRREVIGPIGKQQTIYSLIIEEDSNNSYPSDGPRGPLGLDGGGQTEAQKKPNTKENDDDDSRGRTRVDCGNVHNSAADEKPPPDPGQPPPGKKNAHTKKVRDLAGRERTITSDDLQRMSLSITESVAPAVLRRAITETWNQILAIDYAISDPFKYMQTVLNQKVEQFSRPQKETKWQKTKTQKTHQKQHYSSRNAPDGSRPTSAHCSHRPISEHSFWMNKDQQKSASGPKTQPDG